MLLRPRPQRSKSQPFWLAKVVAWDIENRNAIVQWFAAVNENQPWHACVWGELMNLLTEEIFENLPIQNKGKGVYTRRNIGKPVHKSMEMLTLNDDTVFHFAFQLTSASKIPAKEVKRMQERLLIEQVRF